MKTLLFIILLLNFQQEFSFIKELKKFIQTVEYNQLSADETTWEEYDRQINSFEIRYEKIKHKLTEEERKNINSIFGKYYQLKANKKYNTLKMNILDKYYLVKGILINQF